MEAEKVKLHDFIEIDYTGSLLDGTIFDTTEERVAKEHGFFTNKMKFGPATICVGEQQVLPGLDFSLVDKEIGHHFTVKLSPEEAFGKRDVKNIKIMPLSSFREHEIQPVPGLQIDVDGQRGTVSSVSGGRVIVNFNHPLSGKEVEYKVHIIKKITDHKEQIVSFLNSSMQIPEKQIKVEIAEGKAEVKIPLALPEQITAAIGKKLAELTGLEEIKFGKMEQVEKHK
ncbi:MAG: peptidylprolyl isomerase [Nanoarchaeota archaeon]|mgnify:CR=1 FL=1